jgi:hypothetical protein
MSVIIQFENLTSSLSSKLLKIRICKAILQMFSVGVKGGFLLWGRK